MNLNHLHIAIAADHAGLILKEELKTMLVNTVGKVIDLGVHSDFPVDYPDLVPSLANSLADQSADLGVLICGSGIGLAIAANRYSFLRAVVCHTAEEAQIARKHNHANVVCLGARFIDAKTAMDCLREFINTAPDLDERHVRRVAKLEKLGTQ